MTRTIFSFSFSSFADFAYGTFSSLSMTGFVRISACLIMSLWKVDRSISRSIDPPSNSTSWKTPTAWSLAAESYEKWKTKSNLPVVNVSVTTSDLPGWYCSLVCGYRKEARISPIKEWQSPLLILYFDSLLFITDQIFLYSICNSAWSLPALFYFRCQRRTLQVLRDRYNWILLPGFTQNSASQKVLHVVPRVSNCLAEIFSF